VRLAKIQFQGQLAINRKRSEPLGLQIVRQLQEAIEAGRVPTGTRLPSTRSLARTLGVSRNTVLTAYEELAARGCVSSRQGAGVFAVAPPTIIDVDMKAVMRDAHYPSRTIAFQDQDGNSLYISY
jgi:GntR family transcriptional regulator/MocR family aminotransferase